MDRAVLDTDILSEVFKGKNPTVAARASTYLKEYGRFTISSVTVVEVISGWRRIEREDRIHEFLTRIAAFEVLPFEASAAAVAGRIEGDLVRTGTPVGRADSMIAATALANRLLLVTGNVQHYERIADLGHPLRLLDWRVA